MTAWTSPGFSQSPARTAAASHILNSTYFQFSIRYCCQRCHTIV